MQLRAALASIVFVVALSAFAHEHPTPSIPKDLETMKKSLVGTWEGMSKMGEEKEQAISVVYEVTSGGTAITERLFPGTPHEMISVYHKDGDTVSMTHFCAFGNAPQMKLKKFDGKVMAFEMTKALGVSSMKEPHMHAVTLTLTDPDTLKQEWVNYMDGKKADVTVLTFKRKK
jgi:hypothetical protein